MDKKSRCLALEKTHVHDVYAKTAHHFQDSRYKAWPRVRKFLADLEPGSIVADVGCGTGKYLHINRDVFKLGSDHCEKLVNIAHQRHHEAMVCDNLHLPYRDNCFDAVISIGVIHHLTSRDRRINALKELARILRPGGKVMIYVWAMEQDHRKFDAQDVLVPWHFQPKHPRRNDHCSINRGEQFQRNTYDKCSKNTPPSHGNEALSGFKTQTKGSVSLPSTPCHQPAQYFKNKNNSISLDVSSEIGANMDSDQNNAQNHLWQKSHKPHSQYFRGLARKGVTPVLSPTTAFGKNCIESKERDVVSGGPRRKKLGKEDHANSFPNILKEKLLNLFGSIGGSTSEEHCKEQMPSKEKDLEYRDLIKYIMQEEADLFSHPKPVLEHSMSTPEGGEVFMVREFPQSSQPQLMKQQTTDSNTDNGTEIQSSHKCDICNLRNCDHMKNPYCGVLQENPSPRRCRNSAVLKQQHEVWKTCPVSNNSGFMEMDISFPDQGHSIVSTEEPKIIVKPGQQGQISSEDSSGFEEDMTDESEGDLSRNCNSMHGLMTVRGCNSDIVKSKSNLDEFSAYEDMPKCSFHLGPLPRDNYKSGKSHGTQVLTNCALTKMTGCETVEAGDEYQITSNVKVKKKNSQNALNFGARHCDNLGPNLNPLSSCSVGTNGGLIEQCNGDISSNQDEPNDSGSGENGSPLLESDSETEEWARTTAQVIRSMQSQMLKNAKESVFESEEDISVKSYLTRNASFNDLECKGGGLIDTDVNGTVNGNGKHGLRRSSESLSLSSVAYSESTSEAEDNVAFDECECGTPCGFRRSLSESNLENTPLGSENTKQIKRADSGPGGYRKSSLQSKKGDLDSKEPQGTYHRYYHVFKEGELVNLIEGYVDCLHILQSYYDHANWCIVAEKVQVWTL